MRLRVPPGGGGPASGRLRAFHVARPARPRRCAGSSRRAGAPVPRRNAPATRRATAWARRATAGADSLVTAAVPAGMGRMFALSQAASVRHGRACLLARLREASGRTVDVASERQTARAEMRTVVETDAERAMVRGAAREAAAGRGGMVVPINEADFTNAVFAGVASGLKAQAAVNLVPAAANLGLAGQATTAQAQIGLTQLNEVLPEGGVRRARRQDRQDSGHVRLPWRADTVDRRLSRCRRRCPAVAVVAGGSAHHPGRFRRHRPPRRSGWYGHADIARQYGPGLRPARHGRGPQR